MSVAASSTPSMITTCLFDNFGNSHRSWRLTLRDWPDKEEVERIETERFAGWSLLSTRKLYNHGTTSLVFPCSLD